MHRTLGLLSAAATLTALASPAAALVISGGPGGTVPANNTAPADDPGFDRVGQFSGGSGVYLGDGWVLTANHVTGKNTFTLGGNTWTRDGGPGQLANPTGQGLTAFSDLYLAHYTLTSGTATPPQGMLTIRGATPAEGDAGTMIGTGRTSGSAVTYYIDTDPDPWVWSTTSFPEADATATGFHTTGPRERRWAISDVATHPLGGGDVQFDLQVVGNDQLGFITLFDEQLNSGQAALNDSGSGLFIKSGGVWELAGIAHLVLGFNGQPGSTALYGNATFYSDLSAYAEQINTTIPEPATAMLLSGLSLALLRRRR